MRAILLLTCLLLSAAVFAQTADDQADDQFTEPTAPASSTTTGSEAPLPEKIRDPDDPSNSPVVNIRTGDNGDRIEEYRVNGQLYMVRIVPRKGIPYTLLDTNGDGRLDATDGNGTVSPVYYTIYRWN